MSTDVMPNGITACTNVILVLIGEQTFIGKHEW